MLFFHFKKLKKKYKIQTSGKIGNYKYSRRNKLNRYRKIIEKTDQTKDWFIEKIDQDVLYTRI